MAVTHIGSTTNILEQMTAELIAQVAQREQTIADKDVELKYRQAKIDQLTHEMAVLKRWKFWRCGERLDPAQLSLLDETLDVDIAAIELELEQLSPTSRTAAAHAGQPKRVRLPMHKNHQIAELLPHR